MGIFAFRKGKEVLIYSHDIFYKNLYTIVDLFVLKSFIRQLLGIYFTILTGKSRKETFQMITDFLDKEKHEKVSYVFKLYISNTN